MVRLFCAFILLDKTRKCLKRHEKDFRPYPRMKKFFRPYLDMTVKWRLTNISHPLFRPYPRFNTNPLRCFGSFRKYYFGRPWAKSEAWNSHDAKDVITSKATRATSSFKDLEFLLNHQLEHWFLIMDVEIWLRNLTVEYTTLSGHVRRPWHWLWPPEWNWWFQHKRLSDHRRS